MIYFIREGHDGPIKIGYTEGDVNGRLNSLQTGNPHPLNLLATIDGDIGMEGELHIRFDKYRISGEWFRPANELIEFISSSGCGSSNIELLAIKIGRIEKFTCESVQSIDKLAAKIDSLSAAVDKSRASTIDRQVKRRAKSLEQELEIKANDLRSVHRQVPAIMSAWAYWDMERRDLDSPSANAIRKRFSVGTQRAMAIRDYITEFIEELAALQNLDGENDTEE